MDYASDVLQGFAAAGDRKGAASLSSEMKDSGVAMDVVSYGTAVSACGKAGDVDGALKLIKVGGFHARRAMSLLVCVCVCVCSVCMQVCVCSVCMYVCVSVFCVYQIVEKVGRKV